MDDDEIKARLRAMWTPELWDRIKSDARAELEASPKYKDRPEAERNAMLESMMQVRERFDEWPPKAKVTSPVMLMGRRKSSKTTSHPRAAPGGRGKNREQGRNGKMTREQVIDSLLGSYANSDLGQRVKAYHAKHGHYPEPSGFSQDIPSDVIGELKAKAWQMAEIMFEQHGAVKVIPMQEFLPDLVQHMRDLYADHGQLPVIKKGHLGGVVVEMESEPSGDRNERGVYRPKEDDGVSILKGAHQTVANNSFDCT